MEKGAHQDHQQAQLSKLVDQCMQRVMQEAKAGLSKLDALASQWPSFEQAFLERNRKRQTSLAGSLSTYERHSNLRTKVLAELKDWLATDPQYQTLTEPLRQLEELEAHSLKLSRKIQRLSERNLALSIRLLRIDVTAGRAPTPEERSRIARKRERAPAGSKAIEYWRGADVIVLEPLDGKPHIRSGDTVVTTPHAGALGSIFERMANASGDALDYFNKYEFYGRTGEAVNRLLQRHPDAAETDVLFAALDGALDVLTRWDKERQA